MSTSSAMREDVGMITRRMFSPSLIIRMWLDIQSIFRAACAAPRRKLPLVFLAAAASTVVRPCRQSSTSRRAMCHSGGTDTNSGWRSAPGSQRRPHNSAAA